MTDEALERFLAQCEDRATGVTLALRALVRRSAIDWVLQAELCWEVHRDGHWQKAADAGGRAYPTEEAYWEDVLELHSWRSVKRRLAIGHFLDDLDPSVRPQVRHELADLGITKAAILAPVADSAPMSTWAKMWTLAKTAHPQALQRAVIEALGQTPRAQGAPGQRFKSLVLRTMPDLDTRRLAEEFFTVGAAVTESDNPVAIQVAAMQECLSEWRGRKSP